MIKAIIFDCDGVIADTERAHYEAFTKALSGFGVKLTWKEYCAKYLAMDDDGCISQALRHKVTKAQSHGKRVGKIKQIKAKLYWQALSKGRIKIYPGVKSFVKRLAARGYPLAIASGSTHPEVKFILKYSKLLPYFRVIVAAEDVKNGKPDPEAYRLALTGLNRKKREFKPSECLVIEDSIHGVQSAKKAGMKCLAVSNSYQPGMLRKAGADFVVKSLKEIQI